MSILKFVHKVFLPNDNKKKKGKRKEKKRKKYYEAVEELEVDGRIAAVETGRVAKGVEERAELFVGGSMVEQLEVDGRVAAVEAGRLTEGVDERIEQFVGSCIPVVPLINSIISSQKNSLLHDNRSSPSGFALGIVIIPRYYGLTITYIYGGRKFSCVQFSQFWQIMNNF